MLNKGGFGRGWLVAFAHALGDALVPPSCLFCGALLRDGRGRVCPACAGSFSPIGDPACPRCGRAWEQGAGEAGRCPDCFRERRHFRVARSVLRYDDALARAIGDFKFRGKTALAAAFGELIVARFPFPAVRHDLAVPVPLHPARLRTRGFNQSLLLARAIRPALTAPLRSDLLLRVRDTPPQVGLGDHERRRNVRDAFAARPSPLWRNARVLLVDDVFTTGATAAECAKVMRRAGARSVDVLTLARAR